MSLYLSTPDWMTLLQLIYRVHSITDLDKYPQRVLELVRQSVPFSYGVFCRAEMDDGAEMMTTSIAGYNIPNNYLVQLEGELNGNSFIKGLCLNPTGPVVRGPMLHQFDRDINKELGQSIIPVDMHLAISSALHVDQTLMGYILLWRDVSQETFAQRDVCAFTYLRQHIALRLQQLVPQQTSESDSLFHLSRCMEKYGLTKREIEVLYHTYSGMSEDEICGILYFSSSTFKKHLNHIYSKLNVNSKVKLIKKVEMETHPYQICG